MYPSESMADPLAEPHEQAVPGGSARRAGADPNAASAGRTEHALRSERARSRGSGHHGGALTSAPDATGVRGILQPNGEAESDDLRVIRDCLRAAGLRAPIARRRRSPENSRRFWFGARSGSGAPRTPNDRATSSSIRASPRRFAASSMPASRSRRRAWAFAVVMEALSASSRGR